MDSYIEIKLKPDAELRLNWLLNAVYSKLHKALFDIKANDIGVSFPNYKYTLGDTLRLHSSKRQLETLEQTNWLGGMIGYCQIEPVKPIPENTQYRIFSRTQSNMTEAKLRRLMRRGSIANTEVKAYRYKMLTQNLEAPYVEFVSGSNGHKHRRYIQLGDLLDNPTAGEFDTFGLSKTATVPWF